VSDQESWLTDTRTSYDTVAASFADHVRDLLDQTPYERAVLMLFAGQVQAAGGGPVADVGCGPGRITAYLRRLGADALGIDLSPAMSRTCAASPIPSELVSSSFAQRSGCLTGRGDLFAAG
jgi:trans-aconitate methyltransferase